MDPPTPSRRKVRFTPKAPPRRSQRLKTDYNSGDEAPSEDLLRRVSKCLNRGKPKVENTAVEVALSPRVASPAPLRTYGNPREGSTSQGAASKDSDYDDEQDLVPLSMLKSEKKKDKKREYQEPWDYEDSYYPIALPMRKPYAGDPEILDAEEFGEAARNEEYDETKINAASELGLLIPDNLPLGKKDTGTSRRNEDAAEAGNTQQTTLAAAASSTKGKEIAEVPSSTKGKEKVESTTNSRRKSTPKKGCDLEDLPSGLIGKMLVYKSGAVKLKLGDIVYEVSPGTGFSFPQDVVAINTVDKNCCKVGDTKELKHAVVKPDIGSLLDSAMDLD